MKQKAKHKIIHNTITLLEEYPFESITIKMICAYSQVNRSTFYDYFLDKYDLLHSIQNYHLQKYKRLLNALYHSVAEGKSNQDCIFQFFKIVLRYIKRNLRFFHAILISEIEQIVAIHRFNSLFRQPFLNEVILILTFRTLHT